jgi:hypothetical protein
MIRVNFLDGDGIGAPAHGAGSGIVFAVELHSEALGNGAPIGVFALHGVFGGVGGFFYGAAEVFWNRHGSDSDLAVLSFQVPRSGLLCASSEVLAKAAKTASVTNFQMVFIGFPP